MGSPFTDAKEIEHIARTDVCGAQRINKIGVVCVALIIMIGAMIAAPFLNRCGSFCRRVQ